MLVKDAESGSSHALTADKPMPRYFFNIDAERPDIVGVNLPDRHSARAEAIRAAGEILKDIDGSLSGEEWVMTVSNESREVVLELRFSAIERDAP